MSSAITRARAAGIVVLIASSLILLATWRGPTTTQAPRRAHYLLLNETAQHDYDLAFKMSLKIAEKKSGIDNVLVLLAALPPSKTVEQTAAELFSTLRVGERTGGRGILYLYSAHENLLKIEVSYALEGDLPDVYCHAAEEAARTYMLSEVPQDFISELIITSNLRATGAALDAATLSAPRWLGGEFLSGGGGALMQGYRRTAADLASAIHRLPTDQLQRYRPAVTAEESTQRYLQSLEAGVSDPQLPLLTEGSQLFRGVVPRDGAQQQRIARYFRSASPYRLIYADELALAVPQPSHSNLPIVLRKGVDGLWYVDEAKSWTYFHRFEDDTDFFVKYQDNPFREELRALNLPHMEKAIYDARVGAGSRHSYPFSLATEIRSLDSKLAVAPGDARAYAALGDLYLFECDWISRATVAYEKAAELEPRNDAYRWRLVDLYLNGSRADKMLGQLKILAEERNASEQTREWYRQYAKAYDFGTD